MARDRWAEWLLERRFGGDGELKREFLQQLANTRDKVLDNAGAIEGKTVLDVGCGDGLIAFGALGRGAAHVIFSDVSQDLLDESRRIAEELGVLDRCSFVRARAEDLSPVEDGSVDVVTTRSVLIYVDDKRRAFEEFFRVLRPGGRISLFEPINNYFPVDRDALAYYPAQELRPLVDKVRAAYERIQPRDSDPMLNFDERDLIDLAQATGFREVHVELRADVEPTPPRRWETFLSASGNPKIPSLAEAMDEVLTAEERERLTEHVRPLVEEGRGVSRLASAWLWASKA